VTDPLFLTLDEVLGIHADQVRRYGGSPGLRDLGLLQSALAMPETTFEGELLHGTVFEMAAAYLFHVARNHPLVDGNKRTALMCALVFLGLNGQRLDADPGTSSSWSMAWPRAESPRPKCRSSFGETA
jgi:death on curing protein